VLTRLKRPDHALVELQRAAELEPARARYAYVHAVALHSAGRGGEAMTALKDNLARHPGDHDTLQALISFSRDAGDATTALEYAERLSRLMPGDPSLARLITDLQQRNKASNGQK
jgi:Tfp pilus assembly protein PilF